jgi:hypothetical protein
MHLEYVIVDEVGCNTSQEEDKARGGGGEKNSG